MQLVIWSAFQAKYFLQVMLIIQLFPYLVIHLAVGASVSTFAFLHSLIVAEWYTRRAIRDDALFNVYDQC